MIGEKAMFSLLVFLTLAVIAGFFLLHALVPGFFSPEAEGERRGEANFIFFLLVFVLSLTTVNQGFRAFRKSS